MGIYVHTGKFVRACAVATRQGRYVGGVDVFRGAEGETAIVAWCGACRG
jgi:hypothetical protein